MKNKILNSNLILGLLITTISLFLSYITYQYATKLNSDQIILQGFLINLSSSFLFIGLTAILFDPLLNLFRENRWKTGLVDEFNKDIKIFSNMSISYILDPLKLGIDHKIISTKSLKKEAHLLLEDILNNLNITMITSALNKLDREGINRLFLQIQLVKSELENTISVYQSIMPRELLAKLLIVRVNFRALFLAIGLLNSVFTQDEEYWTSNGTDQESIILVFRENIANHIYNYLMSVSKFRKTLSKTS